MRSFQFHEIFVAPHAKGGNIIDSMWTLFWGTVLLNKPTIQVPQGSFQGHFLMSKKANVYGQKGLHKLRSGTVGDEEAMSVEGMEGIHSACEDKANAHVFYCRPL